MPKQVNFVPNERVDLSDLTYGTSTFTVDSLKSHVQRLVSGDYHGGFVLEGFRISFSDTDALARRFYVHNGIALDRDGRLITYEDGDNFSSNVDLEQSFILTNAFGDHYVMVEIALDDVNNDARAVWDPTYPNTPITDSAGNTHSAPLGKEFPLTIPTRRAISWKIVVNFGGPFSDIADLGTEGHTLRIPIAILPVVNDGAGNGVIDTTKVTREIPWTTVIETPQANQDYLVCANTRIFDPEGRLEVIDRVGNTVIAAGVDSGYAKNDDDNNVIASITQNATNTLLENVRAGDIVLHKQDYNGNATPQNYLVAGSSYDCRPLLFSFTDPVADSAETASVKRQPRNQRFQAAIALLRKYVTSATTVDYPSATASSYKVQLTSDPSRVEVNLKQGQDLLRSIGALIREMKYGDPINLYYSTVGPISFSSTSFPNSTTQIPMYVTSGHPEFRNGVNTSYIGATVKFTATTPTVALQNQETTITGVTADFGNAPAAPEGFRYGLTVSPALPAVPGAGEQFSITKGIEENTKFVDNYAMGNLNEVYRARIDRVINSWSSDLQERLAINKIPVVTVGDGINTFGDFNGDGGLQQALTEISNLTHGGAVYIKRGTYTVDNPLTVRSDTVVMGDGIGITNLNFSTTSDRFILAPRGTQTEVYNVRFEGFSATAGAVTDPTTTGRGSVVTNTDITSYPVINFSIDNCYMKGGSFHNNTAAVGLRDRALFHLIALQSPLPLTKTTENIRITNSRFFVEGSGLYLSSARNVNISECIFESETNVSSASDFVGMVQGIVFANGAPSGNIYGNSDTTAALVAGEVSISDCQFRGPQTNLTSLPYRGWVFFAPNFTGQNSTVSNCRFISDPEGDDYLELNVPPHYNSAQALAASYSFGVGVVSASTEVVKVSGCTFHSLAEGVRCAQGQTVIEDSTFVVCDHGVRVGCPTAAGGGGAWQDYNYDDILVSYAFTPTVPYLADVKGCSFISSQYHPNNVGVDVIPQQVFTGHKDLTVSSCSFSGLDYGVSYYRTSAYTYTLGAFLTMLDTFTIKNCKFSHINKEAVRGDNATNLLTGSTDRYWAFTNFSFKNNSLNNIMVGNGGGTFVAVSGKSVFVTGNDISDSNVSTASAKMFYIGTPKNLVLSNNHVWNSIQVTNAVGVDLTFAHISLNSLGEPSLVIEGNSVDSDIAPTGFGINNGIKFDTVYTSHTSLENLTFPKLKLKNNSFNLKNPNFIIMAYQSAGGLGVTRSFLWRSADVIGNNFTADVGGVGTVVNYSNYDNYRSYPLYGFGAKSAQYLGGGASSDKYCGLLDLRMFDYERPLTVIPTEYENYCNISDNTIYIDASEGGSNWNTTALMGVAPNQTNKTHQILVGIRLSKLPASVNVHNNRVYGAPVILNNNFWNYRNDVAGEDPGDPDIQFTNNYIEGSREVYSGFGCLVDITPATGAGTAPKGGAGTDAGHPGTTSPVLQGRSPQLQMSGNIFQTTDPQIDVTTYQDTREVVRLGQLDASYMPFNIAGLESDQVDTPFLRYFWQINNNVFGGMPIIIEDNGMTGGSAGTHLGLLTYAGAGGPPDWWNTSGLAEGVRLIVIENNQFNFGYNSTDATSTGFRPGQMLCVEKPVGLARLYISNSPSGNVPGGTAGGIYDMLNIQLNRWPSIDAVPAPGPVFNTATQGKSVSGTPYNVRSYLIIQNNSGTGIVPPGGFPNPAVTRHAFTGSWLNQG